MLKVLVAAETSEKYTLILGLNDFLALLVSLSNAMIKLIAAYSSCIGAPTQLLNHSHKISIDKSNTYTVMPLPRSLMLVTDHEELTDLVTRCALIRRQRPRTIPFRVNDIRPHQCRRHRCRRYHKVCR